MPFKIASAAHMAKLATAEARRDAKRAALQAARSGSKSEDRAHDEWTDACDAVAKVAETFPATNRASLTKAYGRHAAAVLTSGDHPVCLAIDTDKGTRYAFLKPAPTLDEYKAMRDAKYTSTVGDLISEAFGIYENLGTELREWYDNLPEGLQQADKGSTLDSSASELEDLASNAPDPDDSFAALPVLHLPSETSSRGDQCAEARAILSDVVTALREAIDEMQEGKTPAGMVVPEAGSTEPKAAEARKDAVDLMGECADACDEASDNSDNVEFPGMY